MTKTEIATDLADYRMLKMRIEGTLKAYSKVLKGYESDLQQYLTKDLPLPLIKVQETLIIKLKAKIEILTDLN